MIENTNNNNKIPIVSSTNLLERGTPWDSHTLPIYYKNTVHS